MATAMMISVPVLICVHSIKRYSKNQIRKYQLCDGKKDCANCPYKK